MELDTFKSRRITIDFALKHIKTWIQWFLETWRVSDWLGETRISVYMLYWWKSKMVQRIPFEFFRLKITSTSSYLLVGTIFMSLAHFHRFLYGFLDHRKPIFLTRQLSNLTFQKSNACNFMEQKVATLQFFYYQLALRGRHFRLIRSMFWSFEKIFFMILRNIVNITKTSSLKNLVIDRSHRDFIRFWIWARFRRRASFLFRFMVPTFIFMFSRPLRKSRFFAILVVFPVFRNKTHFSKRVETFSNL